MSPGKILIPAIFKGVKRLADDSVSASFVSAKEMDSVDFGTLDMLRKSSGWLSFAVNEDELPEAPKLPAPSMPGQKSEAQMLRNAIFMAWKLTTDQSMDEDRYYKQRMREFRWSITDELPPMEDNA
jgi:hypothetical protein